MKYSYNKLWKILINRHMTKTQMRIKAGISTNILAKWEKMNSLQWTVLQRLLLPCNVGLMI